MVAADAGFYSRENEKTGQVLGVKWMSVPNKKTTSSERNVCSISVGFVEGKSGGRDRRVESACSNADTGCVVASIPDWRACGDG